ncbi:MAG TPA: CHC2 zinc finger domain-containing protein, partial [Thermomicrobiaceae bacterium]|nr:CHC2 zinc finger domain-containing protein [Thermomicrobiaceae bacterium]
TLVGRCPFHRDLGRPNLTIFPESQSWFCFRCGAGGDVINFIQRIEGLSFRRAIARLADTEPSAAHQIGSPIALMHVTKPLTLDLAQRACLTAAIELYHRRLLREPPALAYLDERGIDRATATRCRVGFAAGNELAHCLRRRGLSIDAAIRIGLLRRDGRDFLAGRIVVPELRAGQPIWLIGRALSSSLNRPKYLALPGPKPLLGLGVLGDSQSVWLCEGVFDWLTLRSWNYPAVALNGTHMRTDILRSLDRFARIYLVFDNDGAGHHAIQTLLLRFGDRACPIALPGVKDVADLAPLPDGRARFARAVAASKVLLDRAA